MADKNENTDENTGQNNENDENENENAEYLPNLVRLEPDIGLGNRSHQNNRKRRSSGSNPRREEGSISFRHFLQKETGHSSTTSYPDLYNCSRQERPHIDRSVVEPESPDLPDFVQDHLAMEHIYFNDGSGLSANMQNLPDFASCVPRIENDESRRPQRLADGALSHENRRLSRNGVPLDLPVPNFPSANEPPVNASVSLPCDLTTEANVISNACETRSPAEIEITNSGGRLPDFLSDGHVLGSCNSQHRDARIVAPENGSGLEGPAERHNLITTLRQENNRLRDELSGLQSILMKKDDRIKELEDLVMALEISKLQMSADANTQTSGKSTTDDGASYSKKVSQSSKSEISKVGKGNVTRVTEECTETVHGSLRPTSAGPNFTERVREMTTSSERLVRELLKIIVDIQKDISLNDESSSSKHDSNRDPDDSASGSASK